MTHAEKVRYMQLDLGERGVPRWCSAPPVFRLLWLFGSELPPPLFLSPLALFVLWALAYSLGMALISVTGYLFLNSLFLAALGDRLSGWMLVVVLTGILTGALMALIYHVSALFLHLPRWRDYVDEALLTNGE